MFTRLIDFLKRSPQEGDGKDLPMPSDPATPPAAVADPAPGGSSTPPLSHLADAVREMLQSQKALLEAIAVRAALANGAVAMPPAPAPSRSIITGDPGDGLRPSAVIDFSRLSPLQQITMGLRAMPAPAPRAVPPKAPARFAAHQEEPDLAPAGAD